MDETYEAFAKKMAEKLIRTTKNKTTRHAYNDAIKVCVAMHKTEIREAWRKKLEKPVRGKELADQ